jgi:small multidrug resistance family-3 protein
MTIGVLAEAAGVNVETIRFYQRKGLMQEPDRPLGSIRRYGEPDLARVHFIKSAQRLGFSLDEVADLLKLDILFAVTAVAEIVGCYLPWLVIKQDKSAWLLIPAAASLGLFAWLLTLHPTAAGRTYAAYGGMYIAVALVWLHFVDGVALTRWDVAGASIALVGMTLIALQPSTAG